MIELPRDGTRLDPAAMPELRRRSVTTSSRRAATRCSAPTTRPASRRSWPQSLTSLPTRTWTRPTLRVAFTPDEEIGEGATLFDIERFGARCAYTIDGSTLGELQDETFSALEVILTVTGVEVHPGQATGKLVNALRFAARILAALPADTLTPETTSGRDGFIHPYSLTGTAGRAQIRLIIRDFDDAAARGSRRAARARRP